MTHSLYGSCSKEVKILWFSYEDQKFVLKIQVISLLQMCFSLLLYVGLGWTHVTSQTLFLFM
jgi:hypothetical protein